MLKDKLIIDSLNTKEGQQLVANWIKIKTNGNVQIEEHTPYTIHILSDRYISIDEIKNIHSKDNKLVPIVNILKDSISVNQLCTYTSKKVLRRKSWDDDFYNLKYGQKITYSNSWDLRYREDNRWDKNDSFTSLFPKLDDYDFFYVKEKNITDDLCEFINLVPSILRSNKIDFILNGDR